jgi:PBSX family phage terminase large subunit
MADAFKPTPAQIDAIKLLGGDALHTLLFGGSRSGKTFIIVWAIVARALLEPGSRHCVLRRYFAMLNKAIVNDTFPKVMQICYPNIPYTLNKSLFFARFPNGSEIWFVGLDEGDKILGNEFATMYFNEVSEMSYDSLETAYSRNAQKCKRIRNHFFYDENPVGKTHWSYKLFVSGLNPTDGTKLIRPENYCSMRMNPVDNLANLSDTYIEQLQSLSARKRARFLEGEWQDDSENALWKRSTMINPFRVHGIDPAELDRIVVAIDPAVTSNDNSDETGIVVVGIKYGKVGIDDHFYVLEDGTRRGSPSEWARAALELYYYYSADRIIGEVNNGGDLIETVIRNEDANVPFKAVRATRGKILRAEPVAALYEQGRVHHDGELQLLEDQMCNYTGADGEKSPDRLDALVWAITELMGDYSGSADNGGHVPLTY